MLSNVLFLSKWAKKCSVVVGLHDAITALSKFRSEITGQRGKRKNEMKKMTERRKNDRKGKKEWSPSYRMLLFQCVHS